MEVACSGGNQQDNVHEDHMAPGDAGEALNGASAQEGNQDYVDDCNMTMDMGRSQNSVDNDGDEDTNNKGGEE